MLMNELNESNTTVGIPTVQTGIGIPAMDVSRNFLYVYTQTCVATGSCNEIVTIFFRNVTHHQVESYKNKE